MTTSVGRLWREPLVHFLVAGALIFGFDAYVGNEDERGDSIIVSVEQVERLTLLWERTWGRPPTDEELQGTVRDYIKDEVYYREALKLGLDVNDQVIRRRMRQKLEFFVVEESEDQVPEPSALRKWHATHIDRYQAPTVYSFDHVYFASLDEVRIEQALRDLEAGLDSMSLGDRISLPPSMTNATSASVAREFGDVFVDELGGLSSGEWSGPVTSGLGVHLVRLNTRKASRALTFDEARPQVERDWRAEARVTAEEAAYEAMRANYDVQIEADSE
ncbi:MAG: peptidyl-prolyl cis-trans isomerase [Candidatus Phaeomarinobacter sp.]